MGLAPTLPFFEKLGEAQTVLLAGAGGGFDVFGALPLFSLLRRAGKSVHLANLSFSEPSFSSAERLAEALYVVDSRTTTRVRYFPERYLSVRLSELGIDTPIYTIPRTGTKPVTEAYQVLVERLKPDAVVLVDGGTDSLMRGDEIGLGTPAEDSASLAAADAVDVPIKLLACIGFGIDTFHGVCHAHFLEAVAELSRAGAYLGAWSLLNGSPEADFYCDAVEVTCRQMDQHPSIVNTSIVAALEGRFGDYHATRRTEGSRLFINPLMALYWGFDLTAVARRNLYLDSIRHTETFIDQQIAIDRFQADIQTLREWVDLPM